MGGCRCGAVPMGEGIGGGPMGEDRLTAERGPTERRGPIRERGEGLRLVERLTELEEPGRGSPPGEPAGGSPGRRTGEEPGRGSSR